MPVTTPRLIRRGSNAVQDGGGVALLERAEARQRPHGEELPVAVVAQIEHAREADRRVVLLVPFAGLALGRREIVHAACYRCAVDLAGRHQREQRPGGLRRRRDLVLAPWRARLVGGAVLAPAAVLALLG